MDQNLVDSHSESDLHFRQNSPCSLLGKKKGKNKLRKTVLISSITNLANCCKHCPLLQAQRLENAREFQVKLSPDSILHLTFEDDNTSNNPLKTYSSKYDGSYKDGLYLNFKIVPTFATENSVKGQAFHKADETYTFNEPNQKQPPDDCLSASKHNKDFFPCREAEAEENIVGDCFKPSARLCEINKIQVKKPTVCHNIERQLVKDSLDYSSEDSCKTDSSQTSDKNSLHTASEELVISLTLKASCVDPASSIEDSQRPTLAFKFKDSEESRLVTKLYISLIPGSVCIDTEKPKQIPASTKQIGHSKILAEDIGHPSAEHTESSEGSHLTIVYTGSSKCSCSSIQSDQALSTLKPWAPSQRFPFFKDTYASQNSTFCVRSLPHYRITSAYRSSQVQKGPPKASKPKKSIILNRNKKDQQFRSKSPISNFHWPKTKNKNTHNAVEINDLYYLPLAQATKCCCSPLLDLMVDLYSAERDSGKLLRVHRKPPKRTEVSKVTPRVSSHCMLNPIRSFERFQYLSPIRRKNNLKMKNIVNYCLGRAGGQNTQKNCKDDVFPTPNNSNIKRNDISTPNKPADEWSSGATLLSSSRNTSIPLSAQLSHSNKRCSSPCLQIGQRSPAPFYLFCKEQGHSCIPCAQTEKHIWSPAASYSDGKCSISHTPCCTKMIQQQKERIYNTGVENMDYGSNQVTCGGLFPKKLSVCSCGTIPQCDKEYISESVRKKTRANSDTVSAAGITESNRVNSPIRICNTEEACCASCQHGFHFCSSHNIGSQEASNNYFIKVASFFENGFSTKILKKDDVEKNKTLKTSNRKNVTFHVGPGTTQEIGPSGTYMASSSKDGFQVPKHFAYSEYPCCQRVHNCCCSEFKNCLNRESIFRVKCGQETRNSCQCSQEISIFNINQTDRCNGRRAATSEIKESEHIQDSSQINRGWRRPCGKHKCCQNNIQKCCQCCMYLQ
uniref:Uncharacterized protein n=1 Tax=Pogona vitticeps TaxID=103695 RepID=A0ABM5G4N8_9SAUR